MSSLAGLRAIEVFFYRYIIPDGINSYSSMLFTDISSLTGLEAMEISVTDMSSLTGLGTMEVHLYRYIIPDGIKITEVLSFTNKMLVRYYFEMA